MQRIGVALVGLLTWAGAHAAGQQATGTTLWRVAATTLATPAALSIGPAAVLWNPAQTEDSARMQLAVEAIQTPSAVDATGLIAALRARAGKIGQLGLLYGRVGLSDVAQTIDSPDPTGGVIPIYTLALGATWSRVVGGTSVGAMLAYHETRLDVSKANRWTMDLGASRSLFGDRLRLAAATHFFSSVRMNDPAQDLFAGAEVRLWKSPATTNTTIIRGRYGISFAHGYPADHQVGLGAEFSKSFAVDAMLTRESSYGSDAGWRPAVGLRIGIGKYRITLARDAGVNEVGSAYRVGVDVRFK